MPKPTNEFHLSQREITRLIYLTGIRPTGYTVRVSRLDGLDDIETASVIVGNAIVRALREVATTHPHLFPNAVRPTRTPRRNRGETHDV